MSIETDAATDDATPTYLKRGDPALADYRPTWLANLADDVTLEGSMMDGAVQGADDVRAILVYIRSLYEVQEFSFAQPISESTFLEDYTARVQGEPIGNVVEITFADDGRTQHIVGNYRPRSSLLLLSRLIGDHFAGTPYARHFASTDAS
jgi:hypothetical protein